MASIALMKAIREAREAAEDKTGLNLEDFVFDCTLYNDPMRCRAELDALAKNDYIKIENGKIIIKYRGFHYVRVFIWQVVSYIGKSILVPIAVTLITMWITNLLNNPTVLVTNQNGGDTNRNRYQYSQLFQELHSELQNSKQGIQ